VERPDLRTLHFSSGVNPVRRWDADRGSPSCSCGCAASWTACSSGLLPGLRGPSAGSFAGIDPL